MDEHHRRGVDSYPVNTADFEPECSSLHPSPVHVITNQQDELDKYQPSIHER